MGDVEATLLYFSAVVKNWDNVSHRRTLKGTATQEGWTSPDLPGLAVLATLRAEGVEVPVLVLTGFGDFESARVAGTFGAAFKAKPLYVDDLEIAVRELITPSRASWRWLDGVPSDPAREQLRAEFSSIAHLLEQLQRATFGDPTWSKQGDLRTVLGIILLQTLANPATPMPAILGCAKGLRRVVTALAGESPLALPSDVETDVIEAWPN